MSIFSFPWCFCNFFLSCFLTIGRYNLSHLVIGRCAGYRVLCVARRVQIYLLQLQKSFSFLCDYLTFISFSPCRTEEEDPGREEEEEQARLQSWSRPTPLLCLLLWSLQPPEQLQVVNVHVQHILTVVQLSILSADQVQQKLQSDQFQNTKQSFLQSLFGKN